jgi:hypothetical protein
MRHKAMNSIWHVMTIIIMSSAFFLLGLFTWWSIQPLKPIITVDDTIQVIPDTIKAGETTYLVYDFCKAGEAHTGRVVRYISGQVVYFLPVLESNVKPGCQSYRLPLLIPSNIKSDTYTYNAEITYEVNPIKTVTYYFTSKPFKVINTEGVDKERER